MLWIINKGKYRSALEILKNLEHIDPNDGEIQFYIALVYLEDESMHERYVKLRLFIFFFINFQ